MLRPEDIDRKAAEWAELDTLFGAHLHQDFDLVHGDEWGAVRDYARESSHEELVASASSIRRLMALFDEEQIERALGRFGMAYHPPGDGYSSYRYWLTAVAEHLEDPEAHPDPPERDVPSP